MSINIYSNTIEREEEVKRKINKNERERETMIVRDGKKKRKKKFHQITSHSMQYEYIWRVE
jgi:hypothetical protein